MQGEIKASERAERLRDSEVWSAAVPTVLDQYNADWQPGADALLAGDVYPGLQPQPKSLFWNQPCLMPSAGANFSLLEQR